MQSSFRALLTVSPHAADRTNLICFLVTSELKVFTVMADFQLTASCFEEPGSYYYKD